MKRQIRKYITNSQYVIWQGGMAKLKSLIKEFNPIIQDQENATLYIFKQNNRVKEVFALMK